MWRRNGDRLKENCIQRTVKFGGGSLMFWGCISGEGLGNLVLVEKNLDSVGYIDLLATNLYSSASKMSLDSFIYQQDNASCHVSRLTMQFLMKITIN